MFVFCNRPSGDASKLRFALSGAAQCAKARTHVSSLMRGQRQTLHSRPVFSKVDRHLRTGLGALGRVCFETLCGICPLCKHRVGTSGRNLYE